MGCKKWVVAEYDKELAVKLAEEQNLDPFAALLMISRGFGSGEDISEFLSETELDFDPYELIDMDKAVARINEAVASFEKIAVYGDYDADGVTATALLYSYLEARGADVIYYIPDRIDDGYGLHCQSLDQLKSYGVCLIVTVDNGITAIREAEYAKELGMELVITDHHQPMDVIPDAVAVVNPHRADCPSQFKDLAGVGVAFKLITALENAPPEEMLQQFGDLVALGTIGDIVPLLGENRAIVKAGLKQITTGSRIGIEALIDAAGAGGKSLSSTSAAFTVVPRINAAGRMGSAVRAVRLMLTDDSSEAEDLALELDQANRERQLLENKIIEEAVAKICASPTLPYDRILVTEGENWHPGVLGIVSARITEMFDRPSILLSGDGDVLKGSGRSVEGFSLFEAINKASAHLLHFGGHCQAAGVSLRRENLDTFRAEINEYAASLPDGMPFPILKLDCRLNPTYLSVDLAEEIGSLEPFGCGNPQPLFGLFNMRLDSVYPVGGGKHLRLTLSKKSASVTAMRFGVTAENFPYKAGDRVDLAVKLDTNEYRGEKTLTVMVREMRLSGMDEDAYFRDMRLYEQYARGEALPAETVRRILPSRGDFSEIYRFLRDNGGWNFGAGDLFCCLSGLNLNFCKVKIILDVMEELHLIEMKNTGNLRIILKPVQAKADLDTSQILLKLKALSD